MFRVVAICLVAMAAFDLTYLNGQHVHAVVEVARALLTSRARAKRTLPRRASRSRAKVTPHKVANGIKTQRTTPREG
jgi:hypothetical protein